MTPVIEYSVDQIQVKGGMLFAFGWAFCPAYDCEELRLRVDGHGSDGAVSTEYIFVTERRTRDDVLAQFPQAHDRALYAGWFVYARLASAHVRAVVLQLKLSNVWCDVPLPCAHEEVSRDRRSLYVQRYAALYRQGIKLLGLVMRGQFRVGLQKVRRVLSQRTSVRIDSVEGLRALVEPSRSVRGWYLIVDHDLGGGANKYREDLAMQLQAQGYGVAVLTTQVSILSDVLIVYAGPEMTRVRLSDKSDVLSWAQTIGLVGLVYNNAVSFPDVASTLDMMVKLKVTTGCKLVVNCHDYFAVCPSQHLINANGRFCGIPNEVDCEKCLTINKRSYVPIYASRGIRLWRKSWALLLNASDEIRMFSEDSVRLFSKVYADGQLKSKIMMIPHRVQASQKVQLVDHFGPLNIGVIGNINFEKGSAVIKRLCEFIDARELPIRVTLFGTIDVKVSSACFSDKGAYRVADLVHLFRDHGVNVCFLPSVCPETFSYACQELIEMGMPVACFDLGAPPERVRPYSLGCVLQSLPDAPAEEIVQELLSFYRLIYLTVDL